MINSPGGWRPFKINASERDESKCNSFKHVETCIRLLEPCLSNMYLQWTLKREGRFILPRLLIYFLFVFKELDE